MCKQAFQEMNHPREVSHWIVQIFLFLFLWMKPVICLFWVYWHRPAMEWGIRSLSGSGSRSTGASSTRSLLVIVLLMLWYLRATVKRKLVTVFFCLFDANIYQTSFSRASFKIEVKQTTNTANLRLSCSICWMELERVRPCGAGGPVGRCHVVVLFTWSTKKILPWLSIRASQSERWSIIDRRWLMKKQTHDSRLLS